jgi:NADPH:quinone reductase-like Zn-dependent oxidoreductase
MPNNQACVLPEFGPENLEWREVPVADPGPREITLRMKAFSINWRDLATVTGHIPHVKMPLIPLSDGVGEVIECGEGVTRFKKGDRVCPMFFPNWISGKAALGVYGQALGGTVDGVLSEYVTLNEESASAVPAHLTDEQAASLPCAALTAWTALSNGGGITVGDSVLLEGTGGVSIFGLQFAKLMGAETVVTSSDDGKLERAKTLGADHVINYKTTPEWGKAAVGLTGGRGVDRVLDVGGPATLAQAIDAITQNGHIEIIGVLSGRDATFSVPKMMFKHATMEGVTVGSRSGFEAMCRAIQVHRTEPVVDSTFDARQLGEALQSMAAGKHFGKITLTL